MAKSGGTFIKVDIGASGELIPLVASTRIRINSMCLVCAAAVLTIQLRSNTTALTGVMSIAVGVPFVIPYNRFGEMETAAGENFNIVLGASAQVSGWINYTLGT